MTELTERDVQQALQGVKTPDSGQDIVSAGLVGGLVVKQGNVQFAIEIDPADAERMEPVRKAAEDAVRGLPGVLSVTAVMTAHRAAEPQNGTGSGTGSDTGGDTRHAPQGQAGGGQQGQQRRLLPQVGAIVAVASGKGGVGKSTTAVNLALAFRAMGLRTGLLDADIYGPSLPTLMGISGKPSSPDGKTIIPMEAYGVTCMSIGFLVPPETPMIWRGPMVMGALEQMMGDVDWGPQDVLVVDMPPGTGDAQLTMAQRVPLAGAVIVSTPQDLALIDARKGLNMFHKVEVPVLGIVENMSYFVCPHCGERSDIFTHGGAQKAAVQMGVDFLGEIPLDMAIREGSDGGKPIVSSDPDGPHARAYRDIAEKIWHKVGSAPAEAPKIVFE